MQSGCRPFVGGVALWMFIAAACMAQAQDRGLITVTVKAGSAAEKAGVKVGDRLLSYDGKPLTSPFALKAWAENLFDKKEVALRLQRGAETVTLTVPVGALDVATRPDFADAVLKAYQAGAAQGASPEQTAAKWKAAAQADGDVGGAAWLWWSVGQVQEANRRWKEARASYARAWELVKAENDVAARCVVLSALGDCCKQLGEAEASVRFYEQSERTAATAELLGWQGDALTNLGHLARTRGDLPSAWDYFRRALSIQEKLAPNSMGVAGSLNNLGHLARTRGDLQAAQDYYQRSLALREKLAPNSLAVANSLYNLGVLAADDRGDLQAAQDYFQRSLALREKLAPNSVAVADSLNDLGGVAYDRGDLSSAQDYFQRSLASQEKLAPNSLHVSGYLNNLGLVAYARGDYQAAQDYNQRSLAIQEKLAPNSLHVAYSLDNLGGIAEARGDLQAAQDYIQHALAIREKLAPNSVAVANSLTDLGNVAYARGDFQAAQDYYQRSLAIEKKLAPNSVAVADSLYNQGEVAYARGDFQAAQDYYQRSLAIEKKLAPNSLDVAGNLHGIAKVLRKQHHPKDALPLLTRAIALVELERGNIPSPDARALLTEFYADEYQDLVLTYLDLQDTQHAFATLERARARSLTDQIAQRGIDFAADAPKDLLDRQHDLDNQRHIAAQARSRLDPDKDKGQFAASDERLHSLDAQQRELTSRIRRQSPRYAGLVSPLPLDLAAVQQTLDPGTLLLEYSVQKDETLLFAVTKTSLNLFRLPLRQEALSKQVKRLQGILSASGSLDDYRPLARQLYDSLLRPAGKQITMARRLLLCPDGCLNTLPFCALIEKLSPASPQKERFLVEAKPLHSIVGMNVYQQLKQQRAEPSAASLLAYGNPVYPQQSAEATPAQTAFVRMGRALVPLPLTADQVKAIAALFAPKARIRLQKAATKTSVFSEAGNARILHFACHGLLDNREPLASALALTSSGKGDDGLLRAYDIFDKLHLHADLVVLSGCETGLGTETLGKSEGIVGLTRAFEYAGARSVAVSLWEIADTSSTALMEAFYRNLKAGKNKDEALRAAQLSLLHGKKADWHDPFHWAAFQLVGYWR